MGESFKNALAIEILCFCPPDNLMPFSPIIVSYACGKFSIKSAAAAKSQAFLIARQMRLNLHMLYLREQCRQIILYPD